MKTKNLAVAMILPLLLLSACSSKKTVVVDEAPVDVAYAKAMDAYHQNRPVEAEDEFKRVLNDFPLSAHAVDAQLALADLYYSTERYEEAASYYTTFHAFHPSHQKASYALFQKGMSHFKEVLSIDRDQSATRKSLFAFEDLLSAYPECSYTEKSEVLIVFLRKRLAESEFYVGKFYFKKKNYRGALARFGEILRQYPDTGLTAKALYYIGESYVRLGEEKLARDAFTTLVSEFPTSPHVGDAKDRLGDT